MSNSVIINGVTITPETKLKCKYCSNEFTLSSEDLTSSNLIIDVCNDDACIKLYAKEQALIQLEKSKTSGDNADFAKKALG